MTLLRRLWLFVRIVGWHDAKFKEETWVGPITAWQITKAVWPKKG